MKRFPLLTAVAGVCLLGALTVGATSASASVWCKNAPANHICEAANRYPVGTELEAELVPGTRVTTSLKTWAVAYCSESKLKLQVMEAGGGKSNTYAAIKAWSFGECLFGEGPLVAEKTGSIKPPYGEFDIFGGGQTSWTSETNSGIQSFNSPGTSVWIPMGEMFGYSNPPHCSYNFWASTITGGSNPQITFSDLPPYYNLAKGYNPKTGESDSRCPERVSLYATYNITTPKPLYIEKE